MLWVIMVWGYMVCLTSYVLADRIAIILFYFILFIQLYPDVVGNYGLRVCSHKYEVIIVMDVYTQNIYKFKGWCK